MALPIQRQQVLIQGGDSESASDLTVPDLFSPRYSQNMRVLKLGEIESVEGFALQNAASQIVSTNGQPMEISGIWHYRDEQDNRRIVAVGDDLSDEVEIWHSIDGGFNWVRLKAMGAVGVGRTPNADMLDNDLFIAFGDGIKVQKYDGSATVIDAGQARPAQLATPTTSANTSGMDGQYSYKQALIDADGLIGPASPASDVISVNNGLRVNIAGITTAGAQGTRLFRNTGDGFVFYALVDLVAGETEYEDSLDDRTLLDRQAEIVNAGDPPPEYDFCFQHKSRIIYMNRDTVAPSDLNIGESVPVENSFRVGQGQDQGDFTTGGSGDFRGEAIIWRERSVWRMTGDGRESWNLIRTGASIGTVSYLSTVRLESGATFTDEKGESGQTDRPAYFYVTPANEFKVFLGDADLTVSAPLQDTLERINYAARDKCRAIEIRSYGWVIVGLPLDSSEVINHWVAWDYKRGFYYSNVGEFLPSIRSIVLSESAADAEIVIAGGALPSQGGDVFRFYNGYSADGSDYTIRLWEKPASLGVPGRLKILRHVEPWFEPTAGAVSVTLNVYEGWPKFGATPFATFTFDLQGSNVDMATPGQLELFSPTTARYAVDTAFVFEWTFTGQIKINYRGRTAGFQVLPPSESRP